jgi:hypothetical protein
VYKVNVECVRPRGHLAPVSGSRKNQPVTDRFRALIDRSDLSQEAVARAMGFKHASGLTRYISSTLFKKPYFSRDLVDKIAKAIVGYGDPPITPEEVYTLAGMLPPDDAPSVESPARSGRNASPHSPESGRVAVVGYVGAGAEVLPFDDYAKGAGFELVEAPMRQGGDCVAVRVRGDSMYPIKDGWLVFYSKNADGVDESCLNKLCVVKVSEGPTLVKEVLRGSKKGHFNLVSWNAPLREDVRLDWASPVIDIRPR